MAKEIDPIIYAKALAKTLDGVCYPVAKHALEIAAVLVEHRLNVERSSILGAARQAVERGSDQMRLKGQ